MLFARISTATVFSIAVLLSSAANAQEYCDGSACSSARGPGSLFRWSAAPCSKEFSGLDEPLVTDRPDFTEASSVVGLGVAQLEIGYTYSFDDEGTNVTLLSGTTSSLWCDSKLAGVESWMELRQRRSWQQPQ